ncbi:hypothetical protein AGMMS50268_26090 [Spirochaetia bacterium]|nr:hypothetical protein AGMMS50268_26090 [Spirochaetia bacterium]
MLHELTIAVDDALYETLQPMVEKQTIGKFLHEALQVRSQSAERSVPSIATFRGTLHHVDTEDIREEVDRHL